MEFTLPVFSKQGCQEQRRDLRRSVREGIGLRMIVADKAGLASGHVIDMTAKGCDYASRNPSNAVST